ncbi:MAG: SIMPL domain-containing protein [Cryobacterium sp.]|nr:SIMPL domain-containing protein [Cryobacterium sp.]MBX3103368.1 SIMPL domain-containing protein [Cryobacterium sp.]
MATALVTVQGSYSTFHPAERATLFVSVSFDGSKRDAVFAKANSAADDIRKRVSALHNEKTGPVTKWSSDQVQVWGSRPWSQDGKQLPFVYHASIGFNAAFSDFAALSKLVEQLASIEGVSLGSITWELTDARLKALTTEVQAKAVQDAAAKAKSYAKAAGFKKVQAVAIADPGMLGNSGSSAEAPRLKMAAMRSFAGREADAVPELSLKPEDIEVSASVDARFEAS